MNKSFGENEKLDGDRGEAIEEVTKMKATSTTSSNEGDQVLVHESQSEIKAPKKKRLFLSKEKKEQAEH